MRLAVVRATPRRILASRERASEGERRIGDTQTEAMSERDFPLPLNAASTQLPLSGQLAQAPATADAAPKGESRRWLELLKWAFSFPAMLGMLMIGRCFYEGRNLFVDPDVWWHIKVGQDILRTHHFPVIDTYSFTVPGHPWIAYEWLGEIPLAIVARLGGNVALVTLLIVLASVIMLSLYYYATLRSGNCKAGFASAVLLCSLAYASFTLRPQMLAYLFLILMLTALAWFRKGVTWPIWSLPLLMLIWVNTHGLFIIGIGVLVVYLLSGLKQFKFGSIEAVAWSQSERTKLLAVLLLCLAVLPLTPYGTQVAVYPFDLAFNQPLNVQNVNEWQSMPFNLSGGKLFLGFLVILSTLQMLFRFEWQLEDFLLLMGGTAMACLHVRFILLFVPFFAPVFAMMLARWVPSYKRAKDKYVLNAAIMAAVIVAMVHYAPSRGFLRQKLSVDFPISAVEYLDQHPAPAPMWNSYWFGGYLVGTGHKVFIDGRADIYERGGVFSDYVQLFEVRPGSLSILDRYHIQSCLISPKESLTTVLTASPKWKRVYQDNTSVLFVRNTGTETPAGK